MRPYIVERRKKIMKAIVKGGKGMQRSINGEKGKRRPVSQGGGGGWAGRRGV